MNKIISALFILFHKITYYWRASRFPWEEECPSVYYTSPPAAEDMKEGSRVLFTARFFPEHKGWFATGTFSTESLDEMKGLQK